MTENEISNKVIGLAIEVHQSLGPGLLESAYKECLYYKLLKSGLSVVKGKPMPLIFEEVKNEVHLAQTLTYMKLGGFKLGLLINFNVSLVKDGIRRVVNRI
jgi:hypothetical protein